MSKKQVIAIEDDAVDENGFLIDMPGWTPEALDAASEKGANSSMIENYDWDEKLRQVHSKYVKDAV